MQKRINNLRRINNLLPELLAEIFIYGIFIQITGIWFVKEKLLYSTGLWIGILVSMVMLIHMSIVILDAVDIAVEKKARFKTTMNSIVRYLIVVGTFFVVYYFKIGNVFAMFLGIMGIKAAAYFHPFADKLIKRYKKRGDESTDNS